MKKQPEKTAQTKAYLTTAFWALYKQKPIAKITIKDVTDRAGFFRSTFYLYFTDVYAVLNDIEDKILNDWQSMLADFAQHGKNETIIEIITLFYERYGEYMSVLLSPQGDPMFLQKIKDAFRPKMFSLFNLPENDAIGVMIFEFIISAMLAFLTEWNRNAKHIPAKEAVALLQSLATENATAVLLRYAASYNAK